MKFISFNKYKSYLESCGYTLEKRTNTYYNLKIISYFFSKAINRECTKCIVNVFLDKENNPTDKIISIATGYGSPFICWDPVRIDMRKKFWKNLSE